MKKGKLKTTTYAISIHPAAVTPWNSAQQEQNHFFCRVCTNLRQYDPYTILFQVNFKNRKCF